MDPKVDQEMWFYHRPRTRKVRNIHKAELMLTTQENIYIFFYNWSFKNEIICFSYLIKNSWLGANGKANLTIITWKLWIMGLYKFWRSISLARYKALSMILKSSTFLWVNWRKINYADNITFMVKGNLSCLVITISEKGIGSSASNQDGVSAKRVTFPPETTEKLYPIK